MSVLLSDENISQAPSTKERQSSFQVTFGFNLPWDAPPLRTIGTNLAYQIQYLLPDNASELNDLYVSGRDRSRRDLYSHLEGLMEEYQLSGRDCLLKVICELARVPFHRDEPWTLMEEILHIILTPSEDQDEEGCVNEVKYDADHRDLCTDKDVFLSAEDLGLSGGDCDAAYPSCPTSPLELVTEHTEVMGWSKHNLVSNDRTVAGVQDSICLHQAHPSPKTKKVVAMLGRSTALFNC
uniref:Uncharacterized protein n=1 Tax=Timema tahoe TaxID=61484 RepID=A0A7R9NX26_9NEOP|nr:unnamed protein product [Timema tahoe]